MSGGRVETDGASVLRAFLQPMSLFFAENTKLASIQDDSRYLGEVWAVPKCMFHGSADETCYAGCIIRSLAVHTQV